MSRQKCLCVVLLFWVPAHPAYWNRPRFDDLRGAREDQQQHKSADERGQFTDDLHSSNIAADNDRDDQQHYSSVDNRDPFVDDLHRSLCRAQTTHTQPMMSGRAG